MKFFEELKKYFCRMGIFVQTSKCASFSTKSYQILAKCIISGFLLNFLVSTSCFFLYKAESFQEYSDSFFYLIIALGIVLWYSNLLWYSQTYANLFDEFSAIFEKSVCFFQVSALNFWLKTFKNEYFDLFFWEKLGSVNFGSGVIYQQIDQKLEKMFGLSHFLLMKIMAPIYTFFVALISICKYFLFGHTTESFQLIFPAM